MARQYKQGTYQVKNKEKYCGTKTEIRYLSSYELKMFEWADRSPAVIQWSAESVVVPYFDPIKKKDRRYIVDLYIKYYGKDKQIFHELIEVKPFSQTKKPTRGKKRVDVYEQEMLTFITNQHKWSAAKRYAEDRGWKFRVITENSIFR